MKTPQSYNSRDHRCEAQEEIKKKKDPSEDFKEQRRWLSLVCIQRYPPPRQQQWPRLPHRRWSQSLPPPSWTNQPIHQPTYLHTYQSIYQSINQPTNQPISLPTYLPLYLLTLYLSISPRQIPSDADLSASVLFCSRLLFSLHLSHPFSLTYPGEPGLNNEDHFPDQGFSG